VDVDFSIDHSAPRSHGNQTREINMEELKQKNPKVSEKWLKKTLQQNSPLEPSKSNMKKMLEYIEAKWFDESLKDKSQASTLMREYFARSCHPYALVQEILKFV
jgi:DNA-binding HxlR family transcriptional regulator